MTLAEIKELREKAAAKATEARSEIEKIKDDMSEGEVKEIEARFDAGMAEYDRLVAQADRMDKLSQVESEINERAKQGKRGNPNANYNPEAQEAEDDAPTYRQAFYELIKSGGDPSQLDNELRTVLRSGSQEFRAQNIASGPAGGFAVPTELLDMLIKSMKMHGPMYDGDVVQEMVTSGGNKLTMPTIDDTANTSAAKSELAAIADDNSGDAVFGLKELDAFVYATPFIKWSMELGQDSIFNMENLLAGLIGERLGRGANALLTNGTGSGQANGIVTASGAGITAAAAAAITADELIDLQHSVDPAYRRAGTTSYMMNDLTLSAVRKLKNAQGDYIWQMGNIQQGIPQTLNGVAVIINQDMPALATGNRAVIFGDFKKYFVRKVGAPVIGVMRERFFPDLGIAGLIRFDGELADAGAVKALTMA